MYMFSSLIFNQMFWYGLVLFQPAQRKILDYFALLFTFPIENLTISQRKIDFENIHMTFSGVPYVYVGENRRSICRCISSSDLKWAQNLDIPRKYVFFICQENFDHLECSDRSETFRNGSIVIFYKKAMSRFFSENYFFMKLFRPKKKHFFEKKKKLTFSRQENSTFSIKFQNRDFEI